MRSHRLSQFHEIDNLRSEACGNRKQRIFRTRMLRVVIARSNQRNIRLRLRVVERNRVRFADFIIFAHLLSQNFRALANAIAVQGTFRTHLSNLPLQQLHRLVVQHARCQQSVIVFKRPPSCRNTQLNISKFIGRRGSKVKESASILDDR